MSMKYLKNVAQLEYERSKCTGCGMCVKVCPHNVFKIENRKAVILDRDRCMECGACMMNCGFEALHVKKGVGCAYAVILGKIKKSEPGCGSSKEVNCC